METFTNKLLFSACWERKEEKKEKKKSFVIYNTREKQNHFTQWNYKQDAFLQHKDLIDIDY